MRQIKEEDGGEDGVNMDLRNSNTSDVHKQ